MMAQSGRQEAGQRSKVRVVLVAALFAAVAAILVTTFGARTAEAAFPGENGKIIFEGLDLSTWNYEIYAAANGSDPVPLTNEPGEDRMPALSPDGKKVAFASNRGGKYAIYVMGTDGSNPTRITDEPGMEDSQPSWSPDGKKLVFVRTITVENNPEIFVADADGSNPTRLTENPTFEGAPAFSPDGSRIAFMSSRDGDSEIFVMGSDGSAPTNLTNNAVYDAAPNWSPNGSKIAFVSDRDGGDTDVFVMGPDGSDPTNLTNNDNSDYDPAFSPAGDKIAFSSDRDGDAEIYTMDAANGSNPTRLTNSPTINADPDWQPLHDTTAPRVERVVPQESAAGITLRANVSAFFSEKMRSGSVNANTVRLFEVGTTTPLAAQVTYDPITRKATLNPDANLQRGARYRAIVNVAARDLAGNRLDQDASAAGNQPKVWFFTVRS